MGNVLTTPQGWRTYLLGFFTLLAGLAVSAGVATHDQTQTLLDQLGIGVDALLAFGGLAIVALRQAISSDGWKSTAVGLFTFVVGLLRLATPLLHIDAGLLDSIEAKGLIVIPMLLGMLPLFFRHAVAKAAISGPRK